MKTKNIKFKLSAAIAIACAAFTAPSQAQSVFVPPYTFPVIGTSPITSQPDFFPMLFQYHYDACSGESACINAINQSLDVTTSVSLVLGQELHNTQSLINSNLNALYLRNNQSYQNAIAYTNFAVSNLATGVSQQYVDQSSVNAISTANGYTVSQVSNLRSVVRAQIAESADITLAAANSYTDNSVNVMSANDRVYTDSVGAASIVSAVKISNAYTDKSVASALVTADANAQSYANNAIVTSVKQSAAYADGVAAATLQSANEFTNFASRQNRQYTDTAVNQLEIRQTAYTNQVTSKLREDMGFMNKRTQDEANAGIAAAAAAPTAPGGQGRWIGGGLSRYRNAVALGLTGAYEDSNSRTFSASLSRALSGGGGTLITLKAGTKF